MSRRMNLHRALPALLAAALPAVGCAADDQPAPAFAPVTCSLASCVADVDAPITAAVDGHLWLSVSALPDDVYRVRSSDPALASVSLDRGLVDVHALAPGEVAVELLDADGLVIDDVDLSLIAPDHLVARMRWVEDGTQQVRDPVAADQPLLVPADSVVGITVTAYFGAFELAGLIDYDITSSLPDGATLDTSGVSEAILLMRAGDHALTYRTGALAETFVLATP